MIPGFTNGSCKNSGSPGRKNNFHIFQEPDFDRFEMQGKNTCIICPGHNFLKLKCPIGNGF